MSAVVVSSPMVPLPFNDNVAPECRRNLLPSFHAATPRPRAAVSPFVRSPSPAIPSRPSSLTDLPMLLDTKEVMEVFEDETPVPEESPCTSNSILARLPFHSLLQTPLKTPLKKLPLKTALVIRPQFVAKENTVQLERFRRSKTRRFFHPYAQEIGAIQALKEVASSPDEVAAKNASEALTVIGEEVPYKLAQQVPGWTCADVQYWVKKIGFEEYVDKFAKQMVDGDLLLQLTETDLKHDVGMVSGLHRKRFLRELQTLKVAADYSSVDESNLDNFLMGLSPELSVYTYQMLTNGVNRSLLSSLTDEMMQNACGITNPIHRLKLTQAFENTKHPDDVEVAMLSKQIDVFISYRRSTGNQLASLIKVLLQLRGYRVFIDVDKLYAGKFDSSLLKNIQAAKHFILVLTPNSLDRLLNDDNCEDWVHKELKCAFEHQKNIIPIFDQSFEFPTKEDQIPNDIRMITKYNGVKWVHDYQDACMQKVVRFISNELNRTTPTTKEMPTLARRTTHQRQWQQTTSVNRTGVSSRSINRGMEPPTPTFTPNGSQERATSTRRKIQSSISTVSDRTRNE
uniref:ADP-ribosyl cyclase/cyclic ADP-ribose hydrolase n=1 Tax=Caenorhabditis tropicalis TaxID=1561998 RepID=A0A1I7TFR1_9PELO